MDAVEPWGNTMKTLYTTLIYLCMTAPVAALPPVDKVFDASENQVLISPIENYQRGQAARLQQEELRLKNEQLRQDIELRKLEAQRLEQERLRLQNEQRELAQTAARLEQDKRANQSNGPDLYEKLSKLGQLRDDGILTEAEFQEVKKKILDENK